MKLNSKMICLGIPLVLASLSALANPPATAPAEKPDNSAVNQRDVEMKTLTPEDQSKGSKEDVEVTRLVRRALTKEHDLSIYAQNVKIITLDGRVTLRGPVHTIEERTRVASIAQKAVGHKKVIVNELEVKN